jgi:hypothetical protein
MDPYNEWTYREIECKLYNIGGIEIIGYAKFGDEWLRLVEKDTEDGIMDAMELLEDEVDRKINAIKTSNPIEKSTINVRKEEDNYETGLHELFD